MGLIYVSAMITHVDICLTLKWNIDGHFDIILDVC